MKQLRLVPLLIVFILILQSKFGFSQNTNIQYSIALNSAISPKNTLPFWFTANTFGTVPNTDFTSLNISFLGNTQTKNNAFNFEYKASFTGFLSPSKKTMINELYGAFHFKNWSVTAGNKNDAILWNGLSSSNGNILKSGNSRALPGINITSNGYVKLPFAKKWLTTKFNYAEYIFNDKRVVDNVHLHHKSLYFKSRLNSKLSLITGLDHYVQWGGTSPIFGKQPSSFKDYLKIITGSSGGKSANVGDQINALGNTVGAYLLQFNYDGLKTNWSFYYSHPFEDRSGREMQNWRDGLYGVFIDLKKSKDFINQILFEFTYTKHMSGSNAPDDADGGRGLDNYFNNGVYNSGWTYFGNTMGSPYFTATPLNNDGVSNGIILGDNRFVAINIGWNGMIHSIKYSAIFSHSTYTGWFDNEYQPQPKQFSGLFEIKIPTNKKIPFNITLSSAFDTGTYRPVNFGGFIKISKTGIF